MWARTCQECGHIQEAKEPVFRFAIPDSYAYAKCKRCHSESLDYGSDSFTVNEAGKIVRVPYSEDEE